MGIISSNKSLSVSNINCGDAFQVQLALTAAPDIVSNPTDIVLILDHSGSMANSLPSLKSGAKKFIDIIAQSTGGAPNQIGSGSRIGIVGFASTAQQNTQLITSVADLKNAVDSFTAGGETNHADAFAKAQQLFQPASSNARVMVMFTDGVTTTGGNPTPVADAAKAQGTLIYIIGLSGNGGIDEQALDSWASAPPSAFVSIAPSDAELESLFENLAANISTPGAENIVITDQVDSCFRITALSAPSAGSVIQLNDTTVRWSIAQLGATQTQAATLSFTVQHIGPCTGEVTVNESIDYTDTTGNVVVFPSPQINVDCGIIVVAEPCPQPLAITVDGCQDTVDFDAGALLVDNQGCILQLNVTLQAVCPDRRVALAVLLSELDDQDTEYKRGMKTFTIPAHDQDTCRDVNVRCINFVLPQDVAFTASPCEERRFRARFIAHYMDDDFVCCGDIV